jgi:hypothetical protein
VWLLVIRRVAFWWRSTLVLVPSHPAKAKPVVAASTSSITVKAKIEPFFAALATMIM